MNFHKIRTQALVLGIVPVMLLLALLVLASAMQRKAQEAAFWSNHSNEVLASIDGAMQSLTDANTTATAYPEKHNPAAVGDYRSSILDMSAQARRLVQLVNDNPAQKRRALTFQKDLESGRNLLDRYFAAVTLGNNVDARRLADSPATLRLGANLAADRENLETHERALAVDRFTELGNGVRNFGWLLLLFTIVSVVVTALTTTRFGFHMVERLRRLGENAARLEAGEFPEPLVGNDELAELDSQYRAMTKRIRDALYQKEAMRSAYEQEHFVATTLQRALLPQKLPSVPGIRIDSAYAPAAQGAEIGGDWYDVFELNDSCFGISIGDVAGHGLRAATVMASVRQSIRTAARCAEDPANVLSLVNRLVCEDDSASIVTAFFAVLDAKSGKLEYAIAGHPSPITVRAGGDVESLPGSGMILGAERLAQYETFEATLDAGSALVLYTDGLVEISRDYLAGVEELKCAVAAEYYNSSENIAEAIQERVFSGRTSHDDSAILFIGITELGTSALVSRTKTWTIDAKAIDQARRVKRALLWHLGQFASSESDFSSSELIFGELLGNIAQHTPGDAEICLEWREGAAVLHMRDRGAPIVRSRFTIDDFAEGGRGLFLVETLAKDVRIERLDGGNRISAVLPVSLQARIALAG